MSFSFFFRTRDVPLPDTPTNTIGEFSKLSGKSYDEIRSHCLRNGTPFCDPDFPANETSIGMPHRAGRYKWMRPKDINRDAKFMADGVSRFDVKQGELGDCWMAAGLVALCDNRSLMDQVVPANQTLDESGVVRFSFWQYGKWTEVIVDDRLPTIYSQPAFISSTDDTEFWSALLEKAYAKLHGSYGALEGGHAIEAMEDFTGGVCEWYDLNDKAPSDLFTIVAKALERSSLLSCAIDTKGSYEMEAELTNGLIKGHAYTISLVKELYLTTGRYVKLIRLRNPWGNDKEWKLAWSDKSSEWYSVNEYDKEQIEFAKSSDGEFWMSFHDFVYNFSKLEICNLGPEALTEELSERHAKRWEMTYHEGEWVRHVSAGGCPNYWKTSFCSNPQFRVEVVAPDENDDEGTMIIALMQKQLKSFKKSTSKNLPIGYSVFKLQDPDRGLIDSQFVRYHGNPTFSSEYTNLREVSNRHKVPPGHYCIIPSTFEPNCEREFLLRIYSENPNQSNAIDETTKILDESSDESDEEEEDEDLWRNEEESEDSDQDDGGGRSEEMMSAMGKLHNLLALKSDEDKDDIGGEDGAIQILADSIRHKADGARSQRRIISAFGELSDHGLEIDAFKLRDIILCAFEEDFELAKFDVDVCKSMVAMLDDDRSGKLNFREAKKLWKSLRKWSQIFQEHDIDKNNYLRSYQLRQVIRSVGYTVSNQTFQTLVQRYGDPEGKLGFQDYIHCVVRLNNMFDVFEESGLEGSIELNLDQFIQTTMYS